jgi:hypothetical protein
MPDLKNQQNSNNFNSDKAAVPVKKTDIFSMISGLFFRTKKNQPVSGPVANKPINLERYHDPEGLTIGKLSFGLWLVENRLLFKKILLAVLIGLCSIFWVYVLVGLFYYFVWGMNIDNKLASDLTAINVNYIRPAKTDLQIEPVQIFQGEDNRYDLAVKVTNPNLKYWVQLSYNFTISGNETVTQNNFILPNDTKYMLLLGKALDGYPNNAQFNLKTVSWHLLNAHKFPNWEKFRSEHLNINISDIKFTPAGSTILAEKLSLNDLQFTAANNSAYNYWETNFIITLFSGNRLVGVNEYLQDNFFANQTKQIGVTWAGNIGAVDNVVVTPDINILDQSVYRKY